MKMVVVVVHRDDAGSLTRSLSKAGYGVTHVKSAGGFLRKQNATILVGVSDRELERVIEIVRHRCHSRTEHTQPMPPVVEQGEVYLSYPVEVEVGGATLFVLDVERFEKF